MRIALVWVATGVLGALFEHNILVEHGAASSLMQRIDEHFFRSLLAGLLGGGLYIFLLRDRLRRFPYFTAWPIMAALMLPVLLITGAYIPSRTDALGGSFAERALSLHWLGEYLYWTLLMGGTMLMVRLNDQYGSGSVGHLSGRYHRPQQELRIFMFLDMRSSTSIAEDLGHVRYFQLLNELFSDITDPIVDQRGEIYQYVGDEISVSWPLKRGLDRQRCIRCFLGIRSKLRSREAHYRSRYGIAPAFKAGFHYGEVTTGEVGLVKKERIFSGDVVNTAARIQEMCNEHGVDNLISKELLDLLLPKGSIAVREIGSIALKGKRSTVSLWTMLHEDTKSAQKT
ncbi:MAG: adenylate/guanylate cyclase domain-containing protein [Flavobacteriales bacterium]|nr:adenylate/guanylate cyclase domain-containing protein [Flavobacteriales bacterium]